MGNCYTNSSQIVNTTVINKTDITQGYAFDDKTLKCINFTKANAYGYRKALNINKYLDKYYGNFTTRDTLTSNSIQLYKLYGILFVVSVKNTDGTLLDLSQITNQISLKVDNENMPLELENNKYMTITRKYALNQTIHVKATYSEYYTGGTYEQDLTITEDLIELIIPTLQIQITLGDN